MDALEERLRGADGPDGRTPSRPKAAAVGEIALDYSHGEDAATRARQRALFAAQLRLAAKLGLPCSIHSRGAEEDTLALLREHLSPDLAAAGRAGSLHCFVGSAQFAAALAPLGLAFGISGIVTFRNADALRAVVPLLPRDRILVETDSPYLAPVPVRGRPCEPAFAVHTARCVAGLLGLPQDEAFRLFSDNARRLFAPPAQDRRSPPRDDDAVALDFDDAHRRAGGNFAALRDDVDPPPAQHGEAGGP